ncbi:MAG: hydroxymyristoyl-ACP dehydratase [Bacteroidales bacterium]|nr:hydroxymyristoyl-ACP dehydratase [Bacteroidales bacterium]
MLVDPFEIEKYIPQRQPMVMVDSLSGCTKNEFISHFIPLSTNLFITNGYFNESGLIENMAQTAALGVGYFKVQSKEKVPLGFIGAIKNLSIVRLPKINQAITTKVSVQYEVLNATLALAEVFIENTKIAHGEFKIFINPLGENQ